MKDLINLIFDCDGTLIDSYGAIVDRICRLFSAHSISCMPESVREYALRTSVKDCIALLCEQNGLDFASLYSEYDSLKEDRTRITLYPHVEEVLADDAFRCFVFTHRGPSCREIFTELHIISSFVEIVDSSFGFRRKPDSEGLDYLVKKYAMDRSRTYYVGDRSIDLDCGKNAGIGTIFFNSSGIDINISKADHTVSDLLEILSLFR